MPLDAYAQQIFLFIRFQVPPPPPKVKGICVAGAGVNRNLSNILKQNISDDSIYFFLTNAQYSVSLSLPRFPRLELPRQRRSSSHFANLAGGPFRPGREGTAGPLVLQEIDVFLAGERIGLCYNQLSTQI